ncbi:MAG: glycosyltransferase [Chloroflexota bacterium]
MNRLHIAQFTNMYHPVINGVVRSVSAFKHALSEMGHNVFVFSHHESGFVDQEPFVFRYPSLDMNLAGNIPAVIPVSPTVDRILPALKLDIIHAHHPVILGETAASKAKKLDTPLVFTFHSQYQEYSRYIPLPQKGVQNFARDMIHFLVGEFIQRCHHIVVPSQGIHKILVDDYGLSKGATVIPTGIDLNLFQHLDSTRMRAEQGWGDQKILISIGRLTKEKNWRTILEASAKAVRKQPDLRLVIIGDGPERSDLIEFAQDLGIASQVDFLGVIPFEEIPHYLAAADCFIFASIAETQGLVTLEAIAAGLPVVAVNATGTSDIVRDGIEGFTTENNSESLAAAVLRMFENTGTLARFKPAALARAKNFEIGQLAKRMEAVYTQSIEDHKRGQFIQIENQKPIHLKIIESVRR